jgi:hypothetical protein
MRRKALEIWLDGRLSRCREASERAMLQVLADRGNHRGEVFGLTVAYLAAQLGLIERSTQYARFRLVGRGLLAVEPKAGKPNIYRLRIPWIEAMIEAARRAAQPRPALRRFPPGAVCEMCGGLMSNHHYDENGELRCPLGP